MTAMRPAPEWLDRALGCAPRRTQVAAGGLEIACSVWDPPSGERPRVAILLVHGNAAQSAWWDPIVPLLTSPALVVAVDLSGHGDSPHRAPYTLAGWAQEVIDVAHAVCGDLPIIVIGHSMGGLVAIEAARADPSLFAGVITFDTPLRRYTADQLAKRQGIAARPLRRHKTRDEAIAAFRTVPPLTWAPPGVPEYVAAHSQRRGEAGWTLKFDPAVYARTTDVDAFIAEPLPRHTYMVRAEDGLIDDAMARELRSLLSSSSHLVTVSGVGHNLILEAPLATAWTMDALISSIARDMTG